MLRRLLSSSATATTTALPSVKPIAAPVNAHTARVLATADTLSRSSDLTDLAALNGVPQEYTHGATVHVQRDCANTMQSLDQHNERRMWNLRFNNEQDGKHTWKNQLMGWTSTGDCLGRTGLRKIKFPTWESAAAFAKKQGFRVVVVEPTRDTKPKPDNSTYQSNFLNNHIAAKLKTTPPRRMMRTLYAHPTGKQSAWVNLGQMATQMGTSTHHTGKAAKSDMVSQDYWASKDYDGDKPAHRYDSWDLRHEWTQKREK